MVASKYAKSTLINISQQKKEKRKRRKQQELRLMFGYQPT